MYRRDIEIACCDAFDLAELIKGHGWTKLAPFRWDAARGALSHAFVTANGAVCSWQVRQSAPDRLHYAITLDAEPSPGEMAQIPAAVRWALRTDESFADFHEMCASYPALGEARRMRRGRLLRSTTVWEDVVKTLCTTCTTWGRTKFMVEALCLHFGPAAADGSRAFPTARALHEASIEEIKRVTGMGYRARYLKALARAVVEEGLDLEALQHDARPTPDLRGALLQLPGIGPYGAANLLMLLGRYDYIAVDSWVRRVVGKGWFGGEAPTEKQIAAAFERFGQWKALVYWFWNWESAAQEWSWREA